MNKIKFYIVDVFTKTKYGGNQLAVFVDYENKLSNDDMLAISKEIGFAETTFIKKKINIKTYEVRIFTPEYEVPFAGHPTIGTAYVISKHLTEKPFDSLTLKLKHADIKVNFTSHEDLDNCVFEMEQAQPEFYSPVTAKQIADGLNININLINMDLPIGDLTTGLRYLIIPLKTLKAVKELYIDTVTAINFLIKYNHYKTNSLSGLTTGFFFITDETYENTSNYNTRMLSVENEILLEDAATGSANGCLLAYLLKHHSTKINAVIEQGFEMGRKSYIHLSGSINNENYTLKVGGQVVSISEGYWNI